jgi:hypothetical protein
LIDLQLNRNEVQMQNLYSQCATLRADQVKANTACRKMRELIGDTE